MRVAVISHTYVVQANRGKLEALARSPGLRMLLVVPRTWQNRDIRQRLRAEAPQEGSLAVARLPAWSLGSGSLITYAPVALWRLLARFKPDLIHLEEEPWSLAALELSLVCRALGVPLTFFTWENTDRPSLLPFRLIRRSVLRHAGAAVAGNAAAKTLLQQRGFGKTVTVLPQLGVDTAAFCPGARGAGPHETVVGYVGRLVTQKGILVLLEAVTRLSAEVRVMVVGSGPLRVQLLRDAKALGLDGRLDLHEAVPHREIPRYLRSMSVLVLPSLATPTWKEQFGHVLVEAMACGVPVVASDSGAIPEVMGDAGLLVREGDAAGLAAALQRVLTDAALRQNLAERGRARVLAHYTNEVVAQRLAAIWREVLS